MSNETALGSTNPGEASSAGAALPSKREQINESRAMSGSGVGHRSVLSPFVEATRSRGSERGSPGSSYAPQSNAPVEPVYRPRSAVKVSREMKELIASGVERYALLGGMTMADAYRRTPFRDGMPRPTYSQFVYWGYKAFSRATIVRRRKSRGLSI